MHTEWVNLVTILAEALAFITGLAFGSFLNVCIARVPRGGSVVTPQSHCMSCGHPIRWYDNFPLLSWLALKARCRDCRAAISWQYPAVELATGVWFALASHKLAAALAFAQPHSTEVWAVSTIETVSTAVLGFILIGLVVMDWRTFLLPDVFTFGGMAAAFFLVCCEAIFLAPGEGQIVMNTTHQLRLRSPGSFASQGNVFLTGPEHLIYGRLVAACSVALLLLLIRWSYKALRKRDGMGLGDVKLLAMIAAFLGFWPAVLALFIGVVAAAIYSVYLVARRQATATTRLPFGSFLGAGGLVAAIYGDRIISAYSSLLR